MKAFTTGAIGFAVLFASFLIVSKAVASAQPTPSGSAPAVSRILGFSATQASTITRFAKEAGPQRVLVLTSDAIATIEYGNAIADALEAGGWKIDGRANNPTRDVAHRFGAIHEDAQVIAIAPESALTLKLREAFRGANINVVSWPASLGTMPGGTAIWIGDAPTK